MACISARTGTYIFAVFNLIMAVISCLMLVGAVVYICNTGFYTDYEDVRDHDAKRYEHLAIMAVQVCIIVFGLLMSVATLLFSSFLMNGIRKENPHHIKVYYVFGVVKVVLGLFALLILASAGVGIPSLSYIYAIVLVIYLIYCAILHMIRHTYLELQKVIERFNHMSLNEKC